MIKLEFMEDPKELTAPDWLKYFDGNIIAVYAQNDVWDIHVFLLYDLTEHGEGFAVEMYNFHKDEKSDNTFDENELLENAMDNLQESKEYKTRGSAINDIIG